MAAEASQMSRYLDLLKLVVKYGRSDLLKEAGTGLDVDPERGKADYDDYDGRKTVTSVGADAAGSAGVASKAVQLAADLESMGPTFVKLGQLLSTRSDLLPPPYTAALARLQDQVEPVPFEQVQRLVEDQLGMPVGKAFRSFEPVPVAAASLGQVHRAVLPNGRTVAVKVRRPGIESQVDSDLAALGRLAGMIGQHTDVGLRYGLSELFGQFAATLRRELDYEAEATNLRYFSRMLAPYAHIAVPRPIAGLTAPGVLTMEYLAGMNLTEYVLPSEIDGAALADELFTAYLHQILKEGVFHADPHPGNVLLLGDGRLALVDLGMVARLDQAMRTKLVQLLLALTDESTDDVVQAAVQLGTPLEGFDRARFTEEVSQLVQSFKERSMAGMRSGTLLLQLAKAGAETGMRMPSQLALLARALLSLERVSLELDPSVQPVEALRRHMAEVVHSEMSVSKGKLVSRLLDAKDLVEQLPGRINRVSEALADGHLEIRVKAFDETEMLRSLQKLANRLTMGLVIAALLVGAALMMKVPTSARVLGYPVIGIVVFLAGAAAAAGLLASIVVNDHDLKLRAKRKSRQKT